MSTVQYYPYLSVIFFGLWFLGSCSCFLGGFGSAQRLILDLSLQTCARKLNNIHAFYSMYIWPKFKDWLKEMHVSVSHIFWYVLWLKIVNIQFSDSKEESIGMMASLSFVPTRCKRRMLSHENPWCILSKPSNRVRE